MFQIQLLYVLIIFSYPLSNESKRSIEPFLSSITNCLESDGEDCEDVFDGIDIFLRKMIPDQTYIPNDFLKQASTFLLILLLCPCSSLLLLLNPICHAYTFCINSQTCKDIIKLIYEL